VSQRSTAPYEGEKEQRSKSSKIWIALSFVLSAVILGWGFTLPFRQPGDPLVTSGGGSPTSLAQDLADRIEQRRSAAEEFRQAAIALDQEFMRAVEKKRGTKRNKLPGIVEVRANWERRVAKVQTQLRQLNNAPEGSLEATYRDELAESLNDGPL
jgi:hypothetical protein